MTLVVALHAGDFSSETLTAFRMPLYFFLSGLFFKRYESFAGFAKRKINKLLIPFVFFYLVTSVLLANLLSMAGYGIDESHVDTLGWRSLWAFVYPENFPNRFIWFLLCLFWVNLIFYFLSLLSGRLCEGRSERCRAVAVSVFSVVCGLTGYACFAFGVNLPAFVDTAFSATPFFCFGFLFRKYTSILTPNRYDRLLPVFVVVSFALTWVCRGGLYFMDNYFVVSPIAVYVGGLCGTMGVLFVAKMLVRLPFVSFWGRYSIIILCTHSLVIHSWRMCLSRLGVAEALPPTLYSVLVFLVTMFSYQAVIPLCRKLIPWFTAQKDLIKV